MRYKLTLHGPKKIKNDVVPHIFNQSQADQIQVVNDTTSSVIDKATQTDIGEIRRARGNCKGLVKF